MLNESLKSKIESLLFIANHPFKKRQLSKILEVDQSQVEEEIKNLISQYNLPSSGIIIIDNGEEVEMTTSPKNAGLIKGFLKKEINKELTPASLETISIIAYRGPISEEELSELRGVNCAIIIRHLLMKGLVIEKEDPPTGGGKILYQASLDFIRQLGINSLEELPDWQKLNRNISLLELKENEPR